MSRLGCPWFADGVDDTAVARLRAAGAIVVGRTNVPAFGHTAFTTNKVFGTTLSPWNAERSPGGSSGGSAAALAAGMVPLATTSDGGGSVARARVAERASGLQADQRRDRAQRDPALDGLLHGVPFGMQLVAPRRRDGLALGLTAAIERERPWPLTAPGFTPFAP
ncbi:MAG TPA: amidase family protein [Baekduia sp.]|uniref:amidase family protein n=1 Tax=Baekduia sp. TaxID=2600305 RepID=UPI002B567CD1|nr:amidase family protein [Baekduia sp.]HMJ37453.1 amidase family protein [Baekduia sp.]